MICHKSPNLSEHLFDISAIKFCPVTVSSFISKISQCRDFLLNKNVINTSFSKLCIHSIKLRLRWESNALTDT